MEVRDIERIDYEKLAEELLLNSYLFHKAAFPRRFNESIRGEMFILKYISENGSGVSPGEIKNEMNISSARIAAALNKMEEKGLVTRETDRRDRRRIVIGLTGEGKKITEGHQKIVIEDTVRILSMLGESDAREYVRIMKRLAGFVPKLLEERGKEKRY